MRILIASANAGVVGGTERYLHALIPALRSAGHDMGFLAERTVPPGGRAVADDTAPRWVVADGGVDAAVDGIAAWRPDIVYAHGLPDPGLEGRLLELAPAVLFAHGYYGTCITGTKTLRWPTMRPCPHRFGVMCLLRYYPRRIGGASPVTLARLYRLARARQRLLGRYAAVVTHGDALRREYVRHGVSPERAHAVPFLVPAPHEPPEPAPAPPPWRLLFVGRMTDLKGGDLALDALPRVADALGPVHLTLVGEGPARSAWRAEAARIAGDDERLTTSFEGWLGDEGLERAWRQAHLLVVPSRWPEPFGMVGVEAAARRRPAAAFDVGGISEWLTDGETGHLAPGDPPTVEGLADAIVRCLADAAHYETLAAAAQAGAQRFTAERHLSALLPILERAAG